MKISVIQMNSQDDKAANLRTAVDLIRQAAERDKPDIVVLPEMFTFFGGTLEQRRAAAEEIPNGDVCRMMSDLAATLGVVVHAGSMYEKDGDKYYNTTVAYGRDGKILATYRKIHRFDVTTPDGVRYAESDTVERGDDIVTYEVDGVTIGCAICYDLRFPELFRRLRDQGAQVIMLPAAFTLMTGKDHWEPLIRARAIETETYMVACGQIFSHDGGKKACWGHSMVVDPWGCVIAQMQDRVGYVTAEPDFDYLNQVRANIPVHQHHVLG